MKNYHWMDLVQSLFDAYDRGADTSCVVDASGNVTEGPGFNVFMVEGRRRAHAPTAACSKASRARTVIELCGSLGMPLHVEPLPADALARRRRGVPHLDRRRRPADREDRRRAAARLPRPGDPPAHDAYWAMHDEPRYRDPVAY